MNSFYVQAQRFAGGDWLGRDPYIPYHWWMRQIPREEWATWFRPGLFYQPPLYSYLLAIPMVFGLDAPLVMRLIQVLLGTASCGLMFGFASRLFGLGVGTIAGLLLALHGPQLAAESQLLRETWMIFLFLGGLALWSRSTGARGAYSPSRTFLICESFPRFVFPLFSGLFFGALGMLHESGWILLASALPIGAWGIMRRRGFSAAARWAGLFFAGFLIGWAPLGARNLALGLPPIPQFTGSALGWAKANRADAPFGGALWIAPAPEFNKIMQGTYGGTLRVMRNTLATYGGELWRFPLHWGQRMLAILAGPENSENICYEYFRLRIPVLAFTLDFRAIWPLGLAGIFAWGLRRWRAAFNRGAAPALLVLSGILLFLVISSVLPHGRYRLVLLPLLIPFSAWFLASLIAALRARRWRRLAARFALLAVLALGQRAITFMLPIGGLRSTDFLVASSTLLEWGRPELAAEELALALSLGVDDPDIHIQQAITLGLAAEQEGRPAEAMIHYRKALALNPKDPAAQARLKALGAR